MSVITLTAMAAMIGSAALARTPCLMPRGPAGAPRRALHRFGPGEVRGLRLRVGGMGEALGGTRRRQLQRFRIYGIQAKATAAVKDAVQAGSHERFLREVAAVQPPLLLAPLISLLQQQGEELFPPDDRRGIVPLVVPLTRDPASGKVTALLRWPTAPEGMAMPLVSVDPATGVLHLLAKKIEDYITRQLAEEDSRGENGARTSVGDAGAGLYTAGSFAASSLPKLDVFLLRKIAAFPDVFERLALDHLQRGDQVSALVTGEYYSTRQHFPGFGRPFVFNAQLLLRVGRKLEARDAARIAMKSPWWTLGASYKEVSELAGWGDAQLEYARERLSEQGSKDDLRKGKDPAQVALDQAAFLLDVASADGTWNAVREQLASLYREGGLPEMAAFISAGPQG